MMTTRIFLILLTFSILTGCDSGRRTNSSDNSDFKTEKNYPNGKPEIVYKQFNDTIINGLTFSFNLKRQLDTLGKITREGYYLNDQAFGLHKFYQDNKVTAIREYILFSVEQIKLLMVIDSLASSSFTSTTTYLNSAYLIDNNDTIENKSSFYKISPQTRITRKDSLRVYIEFFEPQIDIKFVELYFDVPGDTSKVRIVQNPEKSLNFGQPIIKTGNQTISGFAFLHGNTIDNNNGDTLGATRLLYFRKDFEIK
jgi:hypothetical protein